jgi:hypothetical protein
MMTSMMQVSSILLTRCVGTGAQFDHDARLSEHGKALTCHPCVRVFQGANQPPYARLHKSHCTRPRTAMMGARLERAVDRAATCPCSRITQSVNFCVWATDFLMIAFADDLPGVIDDDGADDRIGTHSTPGARGQLQCTPHKAGVLRAGC